MKRSFILIILLPLIALIGCSKEENALPAAADPQLKAANCTPNVMNYDKTFPVNEMFIPTLCFGEPIMVTFWEANNTGRLVVAASCRFNDKGTQTHTITGVGLSSSQPYQASYTDDYHFIGSMTGQGAQVTRLVQNAVFTNLVTGVTYTQSFILHQVVNANGEITVDYVEFVPCE
ncbi:MAG: hypothetical protein K0B08_07080 [Bacteroidales bacterium]|nr:hypothetical protein [Bacteroidales bacterium]